MKRIILCLLFFPLILSAQEMLSETNYRIYSVRSLKEVSVNEIVKDMQHYDVLFFGEEHDDSVTHYLEKFLLERLYSSFGNDLALSLEMFDRDVQVIMDEYLDGLIREKNFIKDARAWNNYKDYRPMVEFAKERSLDVICANAPSRYTNLAGRKGQEALLKLPAASKMYIAPLPYDTAYGAYHEKLMAISGHGPMGSFSMVTAQSLWDATMAYSIAEYLKKNKGKKIMQVNGKFHSDEGFAIVTQLKKYRPQAKVLIISTASDEAFPQINWDLYRASGDYIIITDPKVPKTF